MTTNEGILRRWSRRKLAATAPSATPAVAVIAEAPDLAPPDLPPIASLGIGSDYTAFLQNGVPAELQRLALARAWQSDAGISAFRGMADYDWDFNAPGYGQLRAIDNVAKLVSAVLATPDDERLAESEPELVTAETPEPASPAPVDTETDAPSSVADAAADAAAGPSANGARRHGSALPC